MILNNKLLTQSAVSSSLVLSGVVTKNSLEQYGSKNKMGQMLGMVLFVLGWLYTAMVFSSKRPQFEKMGIVIASLSILTSVILIKQMDKKSIGAPMFASAWVALGYLTSSHLDGLMRYSGLIPSSFVISSMMAMLPWQRKNNIVDGPGMPLFTLAWVLLSMLNATK